MNLFDASALLCFLLDEAGADGVESALESAPARCSAVNWSEVADRIYRRGQDWRSVRALLLDYDLTVEPVLADDAEVAARLSRPGSGLSLADRICLATGERLNATIWTSDRAWGSAGRIRQVR